MPDSISNIMNTVVYWNTIWMIVLSILIFVILYFVVDLFLKKLDSLEKEDSEKKWIQYLSKIMNKFPKWLFVAMEMIWIKSDRYSRTCGFSVWSFSFTRCSRVSNFARWCKSMNSSSDFIHSLSSNRSVIGDYSSSE